MKTNLVWLIGLCCLLSAPTFAQKELTARFPEKLKNRNYINYLLHETEEQLYTFSSTKKEFLIEAYNKETLLPETVGVYNLPDEKAKLEFVIGYEKQAHVYYSIQDKNQLTLYVSGINFRGETIKEAKQVMQVSISEDYGVGRFDLAKRGPNVTKQLIYHHYHAGGAKYFSFPEQKMTLALMDANMELVKVVEKNFRGEKIAERRVYKEVLLDAADNWYISSANWYTSEDSQSKAYLYQYKVDDNSIKPIKKYELSLPNHYIEHPLVSFVGDNKLVFLSSMSTLSFNEKGKIKDYFCPGYIGMEINLSTGVINQEFTERFSSKALAQFPAYDKDSEPPYQLTGWFEPVDVLATKEGYFLVLEERFVKIISDIDLNFFYYNDLIICKLEQDYRTEWINLLRKRQRTAINTLSPIVERHQSAKITVNGGGIGKDSRRFLSYTIIEREGALYFVFLDSPKDLKGNPYNSGLQLNMDAEVLATAVVNKSGIAEKRELIKGAIRQRSTLLHRSTDNKAYLMARSRGKHSFLELTLP